MLHIPSRHLRIGDQLRFPLDRLGSGSAPYRHSFEIVAFRLGVVDCRRLADGLERSVSLCWAEEYDRDRRPCVADDASDDRRLARAEGLAKIRRDRLRAAWADLAPCDAPSGGYYYVTARKGPQWVALLGPFRSHYWALQYVHTCRRIANGRYRDDWAEIGYGTAKVASTVTGKFNNDVFQPIGG